MYICHKSDVDKWIFDAIEEFVMKGIKEQAQDRLVSIFVNKEGEEREVIQTKDEIIIRYNR